MAGHNYFPRYMSSLWSTLFAPFNLLFTRLWRFFAHALALDTHHFASLPSTNPTSSSPTPSFCFSPDVSLSPRPTSPSGSSPDTATHSLPPSGPSPDLQDQNSSRRIAGDGLLDLVVAHDSPDGEGNNTDKGHTADLSPEDYQHQQQQQQSIDMTNKRAGRGRGGAKPTTHRPMTGTPVISVTPTADHAKDWPASVSQSENNASGHTSFTPIHTNSPRHTPFGRGDGRSYNRSSPMLQQQAIKDVKENAALPKYNDSASPMSPSHTLGSVSFAAMDNTSRPKDPGTRSYPTIDRPSTAYAMGNMSDGTSKPYSDTEQLHVVAGRLTLDGAPSCLQQTQQTLDEVTSVIEPPALPVPLVVAVPALSQLQTAQSLTETPPAPHLPGLIEPTTDEERAERDYHLKFMREALYMGDLALKTNETPVGCVLVYRGRVIARGMNATNVTRNGTRHAEFMALSALLSHRESGDVKMADSNPDLDVASWGDIDPTDGHIYPYGQKLHPAPIVDRSIISECVLYVTVEPCVMCASLLRQLGIKKVYFGAVNDKFGGTGGVFRVHMNSKPVTVPKGRPYQQGYGPPELHLISKGRAVALPRDEDDGDGGNVEPGYPVEGGYLRDDAVSLLRRFYVQENGRAPQPRKKEGRAARLYASMETNAMEPNNRTVNASDLSDNAPETPVEPDAHTEPSGNSDSTINAAYV